MPNRSRYGFLPEKEINPFDWRLGGVSGAEKKVIREDGDYTNFLPDLELQKNKIFDSMACVSFSALNCLETLAKVEGISLNRSDRFTAKESGTTKKGNSMRQVAESIRKIHGTVEEHVWPFDRDTFDWDTYYSEIPDTIKALGKEFLEEWEVLWEWVPTDDLREALKYGPIQVTVDAWPAPNSKGLYTRRVERGYNHAVMLYKSTDEAYEIYDHYDKKYKKLVPDYQFGHAIQFILTRKTTNNMPALPNNILVQDVEGSGAFAMHLNGKLMVDDAAKVLATVIMRSPRMTVNGVETLAMLPPRPLSKTEWSAFPKVNMKNEPIT
jgi:hypothetical protein